MEIHVTKKKDSKILNRIELFGELTYQGTTPSRADVKKKISQQQGVAEELIAITRIAPVFGAKMSKVEAHIYNDKGHMIIEPKYLETKGHKKDGAKKKE